MPTPRLAAGLAVGVAAAIVTPGGWGWLTRMVVGWDVAAILYLVLTTFMFVRASEARIRTRARKQDETAAIILLIAALGAALSFLAIIVLLGGSKDIGGTARALRLTLAVSTILVSWTFLHMVYAVHYAHQFYRSATKDQDGPPRRGLNFQGDPPTPLYADFAYHAFTIGMTAQTSDTGVSTPEMRAIALGHGVLSFLFNTVILALTINILAGLV